MKWAVVVTGVGLVVWGGYLHWAGWLIVQVERGWSSVIAGAVFLAAGFVLLAIAAVMARLEAFSAALDRRAQPANDAAAPAARMRSDAHKAEQPVSPPATGSQKDAAPELGAPRRPFPPPPPLRPDAGELRGGIPGALGARSGEPESVPPLGGALSPPKIIRRYQSQGIDYTLYEDGAIDAEAGGERRRFASIEQLREFLARQRL